jgi:uncharacterized protein (TIGR03066 family)
MKKILVITLMLLMCVMVGCGSKNNKSEKQESLEETIIGMWITSAGTADSTARIYKFYESGIMDSYIGNTKDDPLTGSYELDGNTLYMNFFDRTNPKKDNKNPFTVVSYDKNEIVVTAEGKTITWKRYE